MANHSAPPEPHPSDTVWLDELCKETGGGQEMLIPLLQAIQVRFRYLPQPQLEHLSSITSLSPSAVVGVATFYDQFRFTPAGRYTVKVCVGTACHVKGAPLVYDALHRALGCAADGDTGPDGMFTLQKVACLGCCTLAPVVQIASVTYGQVSAASAPEILKDFLRRRNDGDKPMSLLISGGGAVPAGEVRVGLGSCCMAGGSAAVAETSRRVLRQMGNPAALKQVGCVGMCHRTPLLEVIMNNGTSCTYERVQAADVPAIIRSHFKPVGMVQRLRSTVSSFSDVVLTGEPERVQVDAHLMSMREGPVLRFLEKQRPIATEHRGALDPTDIDEYLRSGGFSALAGCLTRRTPQEVIGIVAASGLRGRGGAGFPTAEKWRRVRDNAGGTVYIVCNGDEGDPGAFMDRMLFESYPYRIIEGMSIAAYAVGATEGVFYIRAEYPLAVTRIREALDRCREKNWSGTHIAGSSFSLNLRIMEGAGAFVCGEETALLQSIEGKRGMPRFRPPYPASKGLFGAPTLINNCETYACVPWILRNGAAPFAAIGTTAGTGTKVFSLAGKVRYGGLIEVPMGMTLRQIVEEIGGGVGEGRRFKAVQIGGPSGGCIPARESDIPVDYTALVKAGAMMGSGGLIVLDDKDCMVDIARYFLTFTQQQSCGRCTLCRVGTRRMLDLLEKLCGGTGTVSDVDALEQLAAAVAQGSLCGLGKTAPNPVLSTLRYFRDEYLAHAAGTCVAGKCSALISYEVTDRCIGCSRCAQVCPVEAIPFTPYHRHAVDDAVCTRCDMCRKGCPAGAIAVVPKKTPVAAAAQEGPSAISHH